MSSVLGVLAKKGTIYGREIRGLVKFLKHRGPDGWGIAYEEECIRSRSYKELENIEFETKWVLAHNLLKIKNECLQPIFLNVLFCFDGNFLNGEYALALFKNNVFSLRRDPVGIKSLYYGENRKIFAFSSEKEPLLSLGINNINSLEPGALLIASSTSIHIKKYRRFFAYPYKFEKLKDALTKSVKKRVNGVSKIGIPFSGGLDSSLLAVISNHFNSNTLLYCIGTEESEDVRVAEKVAYEIGLPLKVKILNEDEVIKGYEKVKRIYLGNLLEVELALSLYLCLCMAKRDGIKVVLSGQGAEELFAGYERHLRTFLQEGDVSSLLKRDLENLYKTDLERNDRICAENSIEGRYPFLDMEVIKYAFEIPAHLNLSKSGGKKLVLRKIAKELGVPKTAYERRKKAVQYGSGIHKILKKQKIVL